MVCIHPYSLRIVETLLKEFVRLDTIAKTAGEVRADSQKIRQTTNQSWVNELKLAGKSLDSSCCNVVRAMKTLHLILQSLLKLDAASVTR